MHEDCTGAACRSTRWLLAPHADPVEAAQCSEDPIKSVTSDGEIIVMLSGAIFEVMAGDTIDSALWLPISDVMICERAMTSRGKGVPTRLGLVGMVAA